MAIEMNQGWYAENAQKKDGVGHQARFGNVERVAYCNGGWKLPGYRKEELSLLWIPSYFATLLDLGSTWERIGFVSDGMLRHSIPL